MSETVTKRSKRPDRGPDGRFLPGNPGGPGNPLAAQVAKLRAALYDALAEGDIKDIVRALLGRAKQGDVAAAKLLLSYTLGKPLEADVLERIERLEALLEERGLL